MLLAQPAHLLGEMIVNDMKLMCTRNPQLGCFSVARDGLLVLWRCDPLQVCNGPSEILKSAVHHVYDNIPSFGERAPSLMADYEHQVVHFSIFHFLPRKYNCEMINPYLLISKT